MSIWNLGLIISILLWALMFKTQIMLIMCLLTAFYVLFAIFYQLKHKNNFTQKMFNSFFNDSGDPSIYLSIEIDMTNIDKFLDNYNSKQPPFKLTYSYVGLKSMTEALKKLGLNQKILCGAQRIDPHVDTGLMVDVEGENLACLFLQNTEQLSLPEIASKLNQKIKSFKTKQIKTTVTQNKIMSNFPSFLAKIIMKFGLFLLSDIEINIYPFNRKHSNRVHCVVSNVSQFSIYNVFTALPAITKLASVAVLTNPLMKPLVVGTRVEVRKVMNIDIVVDSRYMDVLRCAKLSKIVKDYWENPINYEHHLALVSGNK